METVTMAALYFLLSGEHVQEREDPTLTDWDRFARAEYVRLAMEEEGEFRASDNQNEIWVNQNLDGQFA